MHELISFIKKNLKPERLEEVSTSVIDAYKAEDDFTLKTYAEALGMGREHENRKKLFYKIIRQLHPDRFPVIMAEYEVAAAAEDSEALKRIKSILELKAGVVQVKNDRLNYEHHENYQPDFEEFDDSDYYDEDDGFIAAVKNVIFGSHNFQIDPADLGQIDGSLDVGACNLDNIDGVEYCRNVRILNLSNNDISNIYDLQFLNDLEELYAADNSIREIDALEDLAYLEILDLSENDIEDISPLLKMSSLKFVNIKNNPVQNNEYIYKLEASGVIVLK